jgi:hypothetical protein
MLLGIVHGVLASVRLYVLSPIIPSQYTISLLYPTRVK